MILFSFLLFLISGNQVCLKLGSTSTPTLPVVHAPPETYPAEWPLWKLWKNDYNRKYNPDEENERFESWRFNLKKVTDHNFRFSQGKESYSQDMNQFADTMPQAMKTMIGPQVPLKTFYKDQKPVLFPPQTVAHDWNWAELGWVSIDRARKIYPTGWAVSTIKAIEVQFYNVTGIQSRLSSQEILDCVNPKSYGTPSTLSAYSYIMKTGVTSEYHYRIRIPPVGRPCRRNRYHPSRTIQDFHLLQPHDERNLKIAVAIIGPISVSIAVTGSFFFYKFGVFYDALCQYEAEEVNHAVLLVGYGTDAHLGDYWIIQNNWGVRWGEKGFARMARSTLVNCGIAAAAIYPRL